MREDAPHDRELGDECDDPHRAAACSGTRKEELLLAPEVLPRVWVLRKFLNELSSVEAMEFLTNKLADSKTNMKFLENMNS